MYQIKFSMSQNTYPGPYAALLRTHRTRRFAPSGRRRYRSDHSEAVPEADRTHRVRAVALLRLAVSSRRLPEPRFRAQPAGGGWGHDPDRRRELRLWKLARARPMG